MSFKEDFKDIVDMAKVVLTEDMLQGKPAPDGSRTLDLKCPYCGTKNKVIWKKGVLPHCPSCGGEYEISEEELEKLAQEDAPKAAAQQSAAGGLFSNGSFFGGAAGKPMIIVIGMTLVLFVAGLIAAFTQGFFSDDAPSADGFESVQYGDIYVPELGRMCSWDEEGNWWYDERTESYFRYNSPDSPEKWTYWFPQISEDFGDYGWMYYDENFEQWYIQVGENDWEEVPDKYDTFSLWYLHDDLSQMDLVSE